MLEVEQKFPIADLEALRAMLARLGAEDRGVVEQTDTYFNHPARDFATTDEALRVRQTGRQACITYKGPKLDSETKTRREIELGVDSPDEWPALLVALGFREVAKVEKSRQAYHCERTPFAVEIVIDQVADLGYFAEIEIAADESQVDQANSIVAQIANELKLDQPERRSYLELLLAKRHSDSLHSA